ncbi:MAG: hypothetical protein AMXMBFR4_18950 [Candidatus Hydrogenedentota bacterium]
MSPARIPLDESEPIEMFRIVSGHMQILKDIHIANALFAMLRAAQFGPMLQAGLGRLAQYPAVVSLLTMMSVHPRGSRNGKRSTYMLMPLGNLRMSGHKRKVK